jgi:hypothetical protein
MRRAEASPARIYRRLLALYPPEFRARYADEMVQLFGDQLRDARLGGAPGGTARTWLRALRDLAVTAASEHAGRDRTVAHSLAAPPSASTRLLGLIGILGGLVIVAAFLPSLPWTLELTTVRLVLFNAGAIAIVIAVHRRQAAVSRRISLAVAIPAIVANAWYLGMVVLSIGRPQPPEADPEFRLVMFFAGVAMWWADAAFGLVTWRLGVVGRWGALALAIGSVLGFTGMSHLELAQGDLGWLVTPASLIGIALNGLGWILLGIDVAFRRRTLAAPPPRREPVHHEEPRQAM